MKDLLLATESRKTNIIQQVAEKTKLLTNGENTSQDLNLIEALCGGDSPLVIANANLGKTLEKEEHQKTYGKDIVSINSIKDLVIKYNLRFTRTRNYKGLLGFDVIDKIKEFGKETNTTVSAAVLERNFYVLTTSKSLEGKSNDVVILIYKINNEFFKIIHTWGMLPNIFRLPIATMFRNELSFSIGCGVIAMLLMSLILGLTVSIQTLLSDTLLLWLPQLAIGVVVWVVVRLCIGDLKVSKKNKLFSKNNWDNFNSYERYN